MNEERKPSYYFKRIGIAISIIVVPIVFIATVGGLFYTFYWIAKQYEDIVGKVILILAGIGLVVLICSVAYYIAGQSMDEDKYIAECKKARKLLIRKQTLKRLQPDNPEYQKQYQKALDDFNKFNLKEIVTTMSVPCVIYFSEVGNGETRIRVSIFDNIVANLSIFDPQLLISNKDKVKFVAGTENEIFLNHANGTDIKYIMLDKDNTERLKQLKVKYMSMENEKVMRTNK